MFKEFSWKTFLAIALTVLVADALLGQAGRDVNWIVALFGIISFIRVLCTPTCE